MRAIGISILGLGIGLMIAAFTGCTIEESSLHPETQQAGSSSSPLSVEGSCKSRDVPPPDVAHKPGYRQFEASVTDSLGWPVPGLTQRDFVLYAGSQTFPVAYFREHKNDAPVAIAVVVDTSGSMMPKLPIVQQPLRDFVNKLNRCDEVALFAFNSKVYLLQPFSTDHEMTAERMQFYASGRSALYDAVDAALQSLERTDYPDRKLILISDGIDHASAATGEEVAARAAKDGIPIYAIGIGDPNAPEKPGISIGPVQFGPYEPVGTPVDVSSYGNLSTHTAAVSGLRPPAPFGAFRVDAKSLEDLSATAGGRTYIVPASGQENGNTFETAIFATAENIAGGYAIGAVVPADVNPSAVKITILKPPGLTVQARPIAPTR